MQPLCVFREILMYTKKIYEKPDECVEPTDGQQQQQPNQQQQQHRRILELHTWTDKGVLTLMDVTNYYLLLCTNSTQSKFHSNSHSHLISTKFLSINNIL